VLGARYEDSPIIVPDASAAPADNVIVYTPSAHPGCLAPHLWLADGSSLYDHFGAGFTLLVADGDRRAADVFVSAAAKRNVPLVVVSLADDRLPALYEARLALIRPDQHVAWRGNEAPADIAQLFDRVTGTASHSGQGPDRQASSVQQPAEHPGQGRGHRPH
jgi:hypothetical protein